jgi:hypothetical protein
MIIQNNETKKINLRRNISSIAQSRKLRQEEKEKMKKQIENERRKKIMEKQKKIDEQNLRNQELSPNKSNTISKSPNINYLISRSPQTSIALMNQKNSHSPQKRPESERSLPISKTNVDNYKVKEEPANIKKFQENMKNQSPTNKDNFADLDDSVNVKNFDSMEINRITNIDYKAAPKEHKFSKSKKTEKSLSKSKKKTKQSFIKRTPLHKKKSNKIIKKNKKKSKTRDVKKKPDVNEDYTIDEIELRKMETNELLEYYDKQYQASQKDNDNLDQLTETNNQTMNTTDMLNEEPHQQSFSKDVIQTSPTNKKDPNDTFTHVNTTKVIHREVHDPEMKRGLKEIKQSPNDFHDSPSETLGTDLFSKTQTQIKSDINNTQEKMKNHLISGRTSKAMIIKSPGSKLSRNQIPATRKVTPNSDHQIMVPEKKVVKAPQAIGKTPSKKNNQSGQSPFYKKIQTPSLQSTISKSYNPESELDVRVDISDPQEIEYSGQSDIPMTSKISNLGQNGVNPENEVKNYNILRYHHDSNVQTESEIPSQIDSHSNLKDPFAKSIDSKVKEKIKNGEFNNELKNDTPSDFRNDKASQQKTISDFDQPISDNRKDFLLSDIGDTSIKDKKMNNVGNDKDNLEQSQKKEVREEKMEITPNQNQNPMRSGSDDEEIFLLNPTKSPNMRKIRKSNRKRKKPKAQNPKNPFHDSDEEQIFRKPENIVENQIVANNQVPIEASADFQITTMNTPNIKKKKKRKKSKRKKSKNKKEKKPRKAYNLLETHTITPQFNTMGNKHEKPVTKPKYSTDHNRNQSPTYATLKKTVNDNPKPFKPANAPNEKSYSNNYEVPQKGFQQIQEPENFGGRFTLGKQMERMNQNWKHPIPQKKISEKEEIVMNNHYPINSSNNDMADRRNQVKKLLRKSRKRLRREIEETNSRRSERSKSPGKSKQLNDSLEHENKMNKYALKGINTDKIKQEVYMKNSILREKIPEINKQLQIDLDNYELYHAKRKLEKKINEKKQRKSSKRDKKDRLKKLEEEIANLTKNVEKQVQDNEEFKSEVKRKYDYDED